MALSDAYATVPEYKARVSNEDGEDDLDIERDLTAVARLIDHTLHRELGFNRDGTAPDDNVARIVIGNGSCDLWIPDHVSITTIAVDRYRAGSYSLTLVSADYELMPLNAASGPEVEPYWQIQATPYGQLGVWPDGCRVRITGIGGWPAVPAAIKSANIELCAILRLESARATNRVTEVSEVIGTSRVAQNIIGELMAKYAHQSAVFV